MLPGAGTILENIHPSPPQGRELVRGFTDIAQAPEEFVARVFPQGNPAERLRIPALHIGGWFDSLHFWQLDDWHSSLLSPASEHQFLRMWTNDHEDYPWRPPGEPLTADFGTDDDVLRTHVATLLAEPISFFDHYLRGREGRWDAPTVAYEHARVGRRVSSSWPPRRVVERTFCPDGAGRLLPGGADGGVGDVVWFHDPKDPVPHPIESEWDQNRNGVPDESSLHERKDVVVFDTEPVPETLDLVGRMEFSGTVVSDVPTVPLVARLLDVHPSGAAHLIAANGIGTTADGVTVFRIRLGDTAYRLPAGHTLRLALSSALGGQHDQPELIQAPRPLRIGLGLRGTRLSLRIDRL